MSTFGALQAYAQQDVSKNNRTFSYSCRARFQLFGDSVNTTARIETTGKKNSIHISEQTAKLLADAGKGHWTMPREEEVEAKGKGKLRTFWLIGGGSDGSTIFTGNDDTSTNFEEVASTGNEQTTKKLHSKDKRLVEWNVDNLSKLLRLVQARRMVTSGAPKKQFNLQHLEDMFSAGRVALEEVEEVIKLPVYDTNNYEHFAEAAESVELGEEIMSELREFVTAIAQMYNSNPFHNFEQCVSKNMSYGGMHMIIQTCNSPTIVLLFISRNCRWYISASHVTMSVTKMLSRIVETDGVDHAYGIANDALCQFAVVLSAIIHDAGKSQIPFALDGNTPELCLC